jgi:hypothetical protein
LIREAKVRGEGETGKFKKKNFGKTGDQQRFSPQDYSAKKGF